MNAGIGLLIEGLVAVLLMITIGYCVVLNKRLARLKADEQTLKGTISELITATEIAERAIAGLKLTVQECNLNLGERLNAAEAVSIHLATQMAASEQVMGKLAQIAALARPQDAAPAAIAPDAKATVAAAQAFATRARLRSQGAAA